MGVGLARCRVHERDLGVDVCVAGEVADGIDGETVRVAADKPAAVVEDDRHGGELLSAARDLAVILLGKVDVDRDAQLRRSLPERGHPAAT